MWVRRPELIPCYLVVVTTVSASTKSTAVCLPNTFSTIDGFTKPFDCIESVTEPEILAILQPMVERYAKERLPGEHFGDFTIRAGYIAPTTEGKAWYDRMGGEGIYRETAAVVA